MQSAHEKAAVAAFERLAAGDLEGLLERVTPEIEWRPAQVTKPYVGPEGVLAALQDWSEAWERWELELLGTSDLGGGFVVLHQRTRGKARGSGIEVDQAYHSVCEIQNGKLARMDQTASPAEALALIEQRRQAP